jgi:fructose-1-phosphate kinase PfkB-like protein
VLVEHRRRRFRALPPAVEVVNPIGSGDCLLAGLVDAWLTNPAHDAETLIRRGLGCALANVVVWDAGAIDPDFARAHEAAIAVERL